jgi:excisionase family DNA binding protein
MGARYPNPRRVKLHRPYTVEELAAALGIHKQTIRRWIKHGMRPIDSGRPTVLRGHDIRAFLESRHTKAKRPCAPGEIFCFKCRVPKKPAGRVADLEVSRPSIGRLVARGPHDHVHVIRDPEPQPAGRSNGVVYVYVALSTSADFGRVRRESAIVAKADIVPMGRQVIDPRRTFDLISV